jgi:hypothetical protein
MTSAAIAALLATTLTPARSFELASQPAGQCILASTIFVDACLVNPGDEITDAIESLGQSNVYRIQRPSVRVILDELTSDLDLYAVLSDGRVIASSIKEGAEPEIIEVFGTGDLFLAVNANQSRTILSRAPYRLRIVSLSISGNQPYPVPSPVPGELGTYSLRVYVLYDEIPIPDMQVTLRLPQDGPPDGAQAAPSSGPRASTNEEGWAQFAELPTSTVALTAGSPPGFVHPPSGYFLPPSTHGAVRVVVRFVLHGSDAGRPRVALDSRLARVEWGAIPEAASYRVETFCQSSSGTGRSIDVTFVDAPIFLTELSDGRYQWRVTATSALGRPLIVNTSLREDGWLTVGDGRSC